MKLVLLLAVLVLGASACGGTALPPQPAAAALHRDFERLVTLADAEGWTIDRTQVEEALPNALMSLCRTTPSARMALRTWLDAEIDKRGDLREAYKASGRDLDAVEELLILTRIRMLLQRSMDSAAEDCPFWLQEEPEFRGRQILDDRWILSVGGGGKGISVIQNGETDFNAGGAGRILVGRGFGRHTTLFTGIELGASAAFPRNADGERENLTVAVDLVVPVVYRHRWVNTYWEAAAGYIAQTTEEELKTSHGFHIGASFGGSTSRKRWLFPGAAFSISYEQIREQSPLHLVKLGFRIAIDFAR